jgi:hypothetical protein
VRCGGNWKRDYGDFYTGTQGETRKQPRSRLRVPAPVPDPTNIYKQFPQLQVEIAHSIRAHSAVLDGEIVCFGPDGRSLFNRLLFRREWPHFIAFDVLAINGEDLRTRPLLERMDRAAQHRMRAHPRRVSRFAIQVSNVSGPESVNCGGNAAYHVGTSDVGMIRKALVRGIERGSGIARLCTLSDSRRRSRCAWAICPDKPRLPLRPIRYSLILYTNR